MYVCIYIYTHISLFIYVSPDLWVLLLVRIYPFIFTSNIKFSNILTLVMYFLLNVCNQLESAA